VDFGEERIVIKELDDIRVLVKRLQSMIICNWLSFSFILFPHESIQDMNQNNPKAIFQ
jgi:hypothetical protein